ncbi:MAG: hypothetical protein ABSG42_00150 [Nitrospirota bacterium]
MKDANLLAALTRVAEGLGIKVNQEKIKKNTGRQPKGGLCYVHGEPRIIIHRGLGDHDKVQVILEALQGFDLENVYIPPEVREAIEGSPLLRQPRS